VKAVANFEVRSECSVHADDLTLIAIHPKGLYHTRIRNIPRADFSTPFLLSVHIYFETERLDFSAEELATSYLAEILNILTFATGAAFRKHRIRQIVDATPSKSAMRNVLMWGDAAEHADPQPFLDARIAKSLERLLGADTPPAVTRAMRWYRLGVGAIAPDDQYIYFWFAVEILAEFSKPTEKVPDKCPRCQSALYCETCKQHPTHKPYAKQAIRLLLKTAEPGLVDETIDRLDLVRNRLMHGATLKEIEADLPEPKEQVVDTLGRLLWKSLLLQFSGKVSEGTIALGYPNTYVHHTVHGVAHVQTVVPEGPDGVFDLNFAGMTVQIVQSGPPQSASPTVLKMTKAQYEQLVRHSYEKSDHKEMLSRICERMKSRDERVLLLVLATDMQIIRRVIASGEAGAWQDLLRTVLGDGDPRSG
jgi:hypothetical protein